MTEHKCPICGEEKYDINYILLDFPCAKASVGIACCGCKSKSAIPVEILEVQEYINERIDKIRLSKITNVIKEKYNETGTESKPV